MLPVPFNHASYAIHALFFVPLLVPRCISCKGLNLLLMLPSHLITPFMRFLLYLSSFLGASRAKDCLEEHRNDEGFGSVCKVRSCKWGM
jgi:hypothetical protein